MSVLSMFDWCENSAIGDAIRASLWLFPVIESFHLLALAVMGGAVLIVSLRMLGYGIQKTPVDQLWRDTWPFLMTSLTVLLVSGGLLFTSEATKLYDHGAFWFKMASLALAMLFTFTVQRKVVLSGNAGPASSKLVALISVALWTGVGVGGRWIGFS